MSITQDGSSTFGTWTTGTTASSATQSWSAGDYVYALVSNISNLTVSSVTSSVVSGSGVTGWQRLADSIPTSAVENQSTNLEAEIWVGYAGANGSGVVTATFSNTGATDASVAVWCLAGTQLVADKVVVAAAGINTGVVGFPSATSQSTNTQAMAIMVTTDDDSPPGTAPAAPTGYTALNGTAGHVSSGSTRVFAMLQNAANGASGTVVSPGATGANQAGGDNGVSVAMTVLLKPGTAPTAPVALTYGTPTDGNLPVLVPALSGGATAYNLWRAPAPGGVAGTYALLQASVTPNATYNDSTATDDVEYSYYIVATNTYGSATGTASLAWGGPPVPGTPTIVAVHDVQVKLQLPTSGSSVDTYNLQRYSGSWSTIATGIAMGTVYTDGGTSADTAYQYRVQATNNGGAGVTYGTTLSLTTAPAQPSGVSLTPAVSGPPEVTVAWTSSASAVSVNVYRSTTVNGSYQIVTGGAAVTGTSFVDSHVLIGQNYWYLLTSLNSLGYESVLTSASGPTSVTEGEGIYMGTERAALYEASQIFVESTPGTTGAATKRLMLTEFLPDIVPDIKKLRTQGFKFDEAVSIGKEYTTGKINGTAAYYDLVYHFASLMTGSPTISTPVSNWWNVTGASGTIGFSVTTATAAGSVTTVLAPASFANAAALQTAIGNLSNVGPGSVLVIGAAPSYLVKFQGYLSTGTATLSAATGTPTPTLAVMATATNTRRWKFVMNATGPETSLQTYTLEKGVPGVANLAQQIAQLTETALQLHFTNKESQLTGDFIGQTAADPFSMTAQSSITNLPAIPINPKDVSVFFGTGLVGVNAPARGIRVMDLEWGCTGRQSPIMTLNDQTNSFDNTVEAQGVEWTQKMSVAQDSVGYGQLALLRAGTQFFRVIEAKGPLIETGFPYRFKITESCMYVAGPKQDVDGLYTGAYESTLINDVSGNMTNAVVVEIDIPQSTL